MEKLQLKQQKPLNPTGCFASDKAKTKENTVLTWWMYSFIED